MQLPFFYNENAITEIEGNLSEETSKHVSQVLRMEKGERIQLTNGKGLLQTAEIKEAYKKSTTVKIIDTQKIEAGKRKLAIGISPIKNTSRFEWFVEKITEIGIHEIIVIKCKRSERQDFRKERMEKILISSMLQSRQVWLPLLSETIELNEVLQNTKFQNKFIAHCIDGHKSNLLQTLSCTDTDRITLIGPEGDFTQEEVDAAIAHRCIPVSLGHSRLRTETAGITAGIMMNAV